MTSWLLTNSIALFLVPPGCLLLSSAAGLLLLRRHRRAGITVIAGSWLALYGLSTEYVANHLLHWLEPAVGDPAADTRGEAIVVMGGGRYFHAPEYGEDTVSLEPLGRLRYAAHLRRRTGKPILVTGGDPEHGGTPEALLMKRILEQDFATPVRWTESASANSDENARFSSDILRTAGVDTIYLVTSAAHMPRAALSFRRAGLTVIPAPTLYTTSARRTILDLLPSARALRKSGVFVHEAIGLAWYRLKFLLSNGPASSPT